MEMHHNHLKDPFCERLPTVSGFKAPNLLQLIKLDMYYKYIYMCVCVLYISMFDFFNI